MDELQCLLATHKLDQQVRVLIHNEPSNDPAEILAQVGELPADITQHAEERMASREIPEKILKLVLVFGRAVHARGARIYAIGKKEAKRFAPLGIDLTPYDGVHVVCSPDGEKIYTVYRNKCFKGLRPKQKQRRSPKFHPEGSF